jgi:hypothetical protein
MTVWDSLNLDTAHFRNQLAMIDPPPPFVIATEALRDGRKHGLTGAALHAFATEALIAHEIPSRLAPLTVSAALAAEARAAQQAAPGAGEPTP